MITILGAGHVGTYLRDALPALGHRTRLWHERLADLLDSDLGSDDLVVNTAGKTDLPWCENNPFDAFDANVTGAVQAARVVLTCPDRRFIHLSSGCVYDGPYDANDQAFTPASPLSPACFYAKTKVMADDVLTASGAFRQGRVAILRPRQVYSPAESPRNTLTKLRGYARLLQTSNSMTSADTIAKTVAALASAAASPLWGRISLVYDRGIATPFLVGSALADLDLRAPPKILRKSDLDSWHKPKRVDTVLSDPVFEDAVNPPEVHEELRRVALQYAEADRFALSYT